MSAVTQDAFHRALGDHAAAAAEAALSGQEPVPAELAESSGLTAAARDHVAASRPLEEIKAELDELQADQAGGLPVDHARMQDLASELQPVRMAAAILAGSYPGTRHTVGIRIGT